MTNKISILYNSVDFELPNDSCLLSALCSALPLGCCPELLTALASSTSSKVLGALAARDDLPDAALETLAMANCTSMRRTLVYSDTFKAWVSSDLLIEWCKADEELARIVAEYLVQFEAADIESVFDFLKTHGDSDVREALASSWNLPKRLRKQLELEQLS